MYFNDSTVQHFLAEQIQPDFQVFSFFTTKSNNEIIYDDRSKYPTKNSCVIMLYEKELRSNSTLTLRTEYKSCITLCPGYMSSSTHSSIAMRSMFNMKGTLTNATIYIRNDKSVFIKAGSPLIIIIDGCYFIDLNDRKIEISWFLSTDPEKFRNTNVYSDFIESWYHKFTTKELKFNSFDNFCVSLNEEHNNLCLAEEFYTPNVIPSSIPEIIAENYDSGITTSGFIYFISILFSLFLLFPILWIFKEKIYKKLNSRTIVVPMN